MNSSDNMSNLTESQQKIKKYFEKYNVEETLADMLNTLAHAQDEKPISFMIKYLIKICPKADLDASGIMINNLEVLDPVLAIHYPDFHNNNHNLFRTYLTKETFLAIKNLKTPKYNNSLRSIIQGGLEYQSNKIGCFSCDPECYETFNLLFYPILQEINQGINIKGFKYVKDYGFKFLQDSKLTQEHQFVKSFKLKIRRNVEGFAFNMTLNKEIREKLRENLVCAVQNINYFDFSQDLGNFNDENKKDFVNNYKKFFKPNTNPFIRQGIRFKDWPKDRNIYVSKNKNTLLWINKEDHIEIINVNPNFNEAFLETFKILEKLENYFNFSWNEKFGYLSTKPNYLGIGLTFSLLIEIPLEKISIFNENLMTISPNLSNIEVKELIGATYQIYLKKTSGCNMSSIINQLDNLIYNLFNGIIMIEKKNEIEKNNKKTSTGIIFKDCFHNKCAFDEECYTIFSNEFREKLIQRQSNEENKFIQISEIKNDIVNHFVFDTHNLINKKFFVVRRNIVGIPLKSRMKIEDYNKINSYFLNFIDKLSLEFLGDMITNEELEYNDKVQKIIETYLINSDNTNINIQKKDKYCFGSKIYITQNCNFIVIANYEDHFTFIFNINHNSILKSFIELENIIKSFENVIPGLVSNQEFGYLTGNPNYSGTGISICYFLNLEDNKRMLIEDDNKDNKEIVIQDETNSLMKLTLNRMNRKRLNSFINFLYIKLQEIKNDKLEKIIKKGRLPILTNEIYENYKNNIKTMGLTLFDCFHPENYRLIALDSSLYNSFPLLYKNFLRSILNESSLLKISDSKNIGEKDIKFDFSKVTTNSMSFKFEIARNFRNYPFSSIIDDGCYNKMKNEIFSVLKQCIPNYSLIEKKYIETSIGSLLFPSDYSSSNHKDQDYYVISPDHGRFAIWCLWDDHIRVVINASQLKIEQELKDVLNFLNKIRECYGEFLFDPNFGFLSEKAENIGFNLKFCISGFVEEKKISVLKTFCNGSKLLLEESVEENSEKRKKINIRSQKVSIFQEDIEIINRIVKGIHEEFKD